MPKISRVIRDLKRLNMGEYEMVETKYSESMEFLFENGKNLRTMGLVNSKLDNIETSVLTVYSKLQTNVQKSLFRDPKDVEILEFQKNVVCIETALQLLKNFVTYDIAPKQAALPAQSGTPANQLLPAYPSLPTNQSPPANQSLPADGEIVRTMRRLNRQLANIEISIVNVLRKLRTIFYKNSFMDPKDVEILEFQRKVAQIETELQLMKYYHI